MSSKTGHKNVNLQGRLPAQLSRQPMRGARAVATRQKLASAQLPQPKAEGASVEAGSGVRDLLEYQRDLYERTILFWDTLRQRADNMLAHERAGKPPLLDFDYA